MKTWEVLAAIGACIIAAYLRAWIYDSIYPRRGYRQKRAESFEKRRKQRKTRR